MSIIGGPERGKEENEQRTGEGNRHTGPGNTKYQTKDEDKQVQTKTRYS